MHVLTDPFVPGYMQRAWLELALLSLPAGLLGVFVVLRRLAFATHALGVGAFPGVVIAFGVGFTAFGGGLAAALILAGLIALLQRRRDLDAPSSTGLALSGALALGAVLVSNVFASSAQVDSLLFGSLFGVTDADLLRTAIVALVTAGTVAVFGRPWVVVAFDRESAPVLGFAPGPLDLALLGLLAVAVVASVDAVGSLLVGALFVVPAALARLFAHRLVPLAVASVLVTLVLSTGGLIVSYYSGAPPGATIAALAAAGFSVAFAIRTLARPKWRTLGVTAAAVLMLIALAGCGGSENAAATSESGSQRVLRVVATTSQVADWARVVGGSEVTVTQLLKPNVDPHEFEPTSDDVAAVANATLVLASGAGLDDWIDGVVENAGSVPLVKVAPTGLRPPPHNQAEAGKFDPHFWHDPALVEMSVRTIAKAFVTAAPDHASTFRKNADRYVAQLQALDAELKREFGEVPAVRRKMVTDHDAFGYLAARYGITVVGSAIPSTSTAAEASAKQVAELIDTIKREGVRAVFSEASVDPKLVDQIAAETGAVVIPDLYGDTLGPPGSGAATYLEMMRHNASVLIEGFNR